MDDVRDPTTTNGQGAAAVLAAASGCFALAILALISDASPLVAASLKFWRPTGPLSGVTDIAIVMWLVLWFVLSRVWSRRNVNMRRVNMTSILLLAAAILLTFPPVMDFLQGK
jgi:hypothetical protein